MQSATTFDHKSHFGERIASVCGAGLVIGLATLLAVTVFGGKTNGGTIIGELRHAARYAWQTIASIDPILGGTALAVVGILAITIFAHNR